MERRIKSSKIPLPTHIHTSHHAIAPSAQGPLNSWTLSLQALTGTPKQKLDFPAIDKILHHYHSRTTGVKPYTDALQPCEHLLPVLDATSHKTVLDEASHVDTDPPVSVKPDLYFPLANSSEDPITVSDHGVLQEKLCTGVVLQEHDIPCIEPDIPILDKDPCPLDDTQRNYDIVQDAQDASLQFSAILDGDAAATIIQRFYKSRIKHSPKPVFVHTALRKWLQYTKRRIYWKKRLSTLQLLYGDDGLHAPRVRRWSNGNRAKVLDEEGIYVFAARFHAWKMAAKCLVKWQEVILYPDPCQSDYTSQRDEIRS
ncbi:hypothetical protein SeLEV6574_g07579 [Synchytrium endobioticum]|nr:hypothetical protein SeLEV6574_g07579 [Synchytrium endobioticum]